MDAPSSSLTLALEIELDAVRALIEAELPGAQKQDWTQVTARDASPRLELRYFIERDPVQLGFENGVLRAQVPMRYWADVRGGVKNPLPWGDDWFDLDRDQTWGTREAPQRMTLVISSRTQLDQQGNLRMQSSIDPLEPGNPPAGSFCVDAGIHLCVSKASFAGEVRNAFKQRIEPALRDAVTALDRALEGRADLSAKLNQQWQQLQCSRALHRGAVLACTPDANEQGSWLQIQPEQLSVSELSLRGTRLRVLVSLEAKLGVTRGTVSAGVARPLPSIEQRSLTPGAALHMSVALPYDLLSSQLSRSLPSADLPVGKQTGTTKLAAARIVGASADASGTKLLLELRLGGDLDALLYAYAEPRPADGYLAFEHLTYTDASERVFVKALPDVDHAALRLALERALRIELEPAAALFEHVVTSLLAEAAPALHPSIEALHIALSDLRLGNQNLLALLTLEAQLTLQIAP